MSAYRTVWFAFFTIAIITWWTKIVIIRKSSAKEILILKSVSLTDPCAITTWMVTWSWRGITSTAKRKGCFGVTIPPGMPNGNFVTRPIWRKIPFAISSQTGGLMQNNWWGTAINCCGVIGMPKGDSELPKGGDAVSWCPRLRIIIM